MENWVLINKRADFELIMKECGVSAVLARCLANKGLTDIEQIKGYLNPKLDGQHDPFLLADMQKACELIWNKIKEGKSIRIIGDYDVDGVVATYILYRTLLRLGARVSYDIPDRVNDGYGINVRIVEAAYNDQIDTILTCDNGIAAIEQIEKAKQYNMTVIVTDHHSLVKAEDGSLLLPPADAIINPQRPDCGYPFKGLCGAAVAYKLSLALLKNQTDSDTSDFIRELVSFVAIATVCDVMDLVGENRIFVKHGLELLKSTKNRGLLALMDAAGLAGTRLNTFHLGYIIGPCLNASGRLDTAKMGLGLLLAEKADEAARLAAELVELNNKRKSMTKKNVEKAVALIEGSSIKDDKILVVYLEDCHESIAGIIAGRIREKYNKPTIIFTDAHDCIKGSGRSIEQYNMIEELQKHRHLFLKLGGHPMAAGMSLQKENIEQLRSLLNGTTSLTEKMLIPKVAIDVHLPIAYVSEALVKELEILEPFGKGNERPLFAEKNLRIRSAMIVGNNAGVKLRLADINGRSIEAVYFGDPAIFFKQIEGCFGANELRRLQTGRSSNATISITYYPNINEYNGFRNLQLNIQNYKFQLQ